jgi:hypothetical protein
MPYFTPNNKKDIKSALKGEGGDAKNSTASNGTQKAKFGDYV